MSERTVSSLRQQLLNNQFGLCVFALTELMMSNMPLCIDEIERRPVLLSRSSTRSLDTLGGTIFWLCPKSCPRGIQIDAALRFFELCALVVQQIVPGASCGSQEDLSGGESDAGRRAIKRQYESRLRGADDER
jgi:hypothetical protein